MIINTSIPFDFFQIVYLITDIEQRPRNVVGIKVCPAGDVLIELNAGTLNSFHYIGEITTEKIYA